MNIVHSLKLWPTVSFMYFANGEVFYIISTINSRKKRRQKDERFTDTVQI